MNLLTNIKAKLLEVANLDYTYPKTKKDVMTFISQNQFDVHSDYVGTVDIIMPTFNRIRETKRIINHLLKTCKLNFKLILIDNNSSDGTKEYLSNLAKQYSNIQIVLLNKNVGGSGSRNEGMKYVTNEFVAFLDNDIYIMPGYFEHLVHTLKSNPGVSAVQSKVIMPNGLIQINRPEYRIEGNWIIFKERDFEKHFSDQTTLISDYCNWLPSGATLWRSSVLIENKFDDTLGTYYEDNEFSYRLNSTGHKFMNCHMAMCIHYSANFAPDKSTNSSYTKTRFNNDAIKSALRNFYRKHKLFLAYRDIAGHLSHLGFKSKAEYEQFLLKDN